IFLGAGTILFLGYTGFSLGLMTGYLSASGYNDTLWPTIITHSSFEILATLMAAVAGMKWGFSLILLGDPLRRHEFGLRFAQSFMLLVNAVIFFIVAALIEAYWSSGYVTSATHKYMTGITSWTLLIYYVLFYGRAATK
ncbi:MAG TPA: stage II sporulation protein M, partial [Gammaproteobacteria bacterium]|nr:stage II sporulation protein M [Gammaproteobacteria bacterium]